MVNEANGAPSHGDMIKLLARCLRSSGANVRTEHRLPNNKIADLCYATPNGSIHVIEVKTFFRPWLLTQAWNKYSYHCHYLWLAIPAGDPYARDFDPPVFGWERFEDQVGLVAVSWTGPTLIKLARLLDGPPLNADLTLRRLRETVTDGEQVQCT